MRRDQGKIVKSAVLVGVTGALVVLLGAILTLAGLHPFRWHRLTVYVASGDNPRSGALVRVRLASVGIPIAIGHTNGAGLASFRLPEGRYTIQAEYKAFSMQLSPARGEQQVDLKSDTRVNLAVRGGM